MDVKTIRELTKLMRQYELAELEVETEGLKVRLSKGMVTQMVSAAPMAAAGPAPLPAPAADAAAPAADADAEFAGCHKVTSPIPGTVYLKPNPEAPVFCKVGEQVDDGQVVCLVEAMKVFNEIKCEGASGTIKKICVEDGQAVEYGTVLFLVG